MPTPDPTTPEPWRHLNAALLLCHGLPRTAAQRLAALHLHTLGLVSDWLARSPDGHRGTPWHEVALDAGAALRAYHAAHQTKHTPAGEAAGGGAVDSSSGSADAATGQGRPSSDVPPEGEPLPCPHCGRAAVVQQDGRTWNAGCPSAVLPGDGVCHRGYAAWLHPTRAEAVAAWNRRAHPAPAPPATDAELAAAADHATTRTERLERELAEARTENARLRDDLQATLLWRQELDDACRERDALLAHCIVRRFGGWLALTGPGAGSWGTFPTEAAAVAAVRTAAGLTTKGGAADA